VEAGIKEPTDLQFPSEEQGMLFRLTFYERRQGIFRKQAASFVYIVFSM